jgi:putative glycosyltransferase (TIGR04372 family)
LFFSFHHKFLAKLGHILNLIILIPHPESIGNASEEIFYGALKAKRDNKKLAIIFAVKPFFLRKRKFYDKNFFSLECDYFYFKHNSFFQNFWAYFFNLIFIIEFFIHRFLVLFFNIKQSGYYWRPLAGQDILWRPNDNIEKFDYNLFLSLKWSNQFKNEIIFKIKNENYNFFFNKLNKFNIKLNDWFVCLHVREGGFKGDHDNPLNVDIENYFPAIQEITKMGGFVIRLGDRSMKKLPLMHNVIDYPFTDLKDPLMDIFLIKNCLFFICMGSGPFSIADFIFRKKILLVNTAQYVHGMPYNKGSSAIFRQVFSKRRKRFLSLKEFLTDVKEIKRDWWISEDHQLHQNNAEEIKLAVNEMLDNEINKNQIINVPTLLQQEYRNEHQKVVDYLLKNFSFSENSFENCNEWYRFAPRINEWNGEISESFLKKNWYKSSRN